MQEPNTLDGLKAAQHYWAKRIADEENDMHQAMRPFQRRLAFLRGRLFYIERLLSTEQALFHPPTLTEPPGS